MSPLTATLRGVRFGYGERMALEGIDLDLRAGELCALVGPNGAGKSTLLALLAGILRPQAGEVRVGEADPAAWSRVEAARRIAFLPNQPQVPPDYSARELVLMALHPFGRGLLADSEEDRARADAALERADALEFAARPAAELSSGERQRVLVARLLCQAAGAQPAQAPALVLLDEPTSAQDVAHELRLFQRLRALAEEEGRAVVVATHALNAAARSAHQLVVLRGGRRLVAGPPSEVLSEETLAEGFSVRARIGQEGGIPYALPLEPLPPAPPTDASCAEG